MAVPKVPNGGNSVVRLNTSLLVIEDYFSELNNSSRTNTFGHNVQYLLYSQKLILYTRNRLKKKNNKISAELSKRYLSPERSR